MITRSVNRYGAACKMDESLLLPPAKECCEEPALEKEHIFLPVPNSTPKRPLTYLPKAKTGEKRQHNRQTVAGSFAVFYMLAVSFLSKDQTTTNTHTYTHANAQPSVHRRGSGRNRIITVIPGERKKVRQS